MPSPSKNHEFITNKYAAAAGCSQSEAAQLSDATLKSFATIQRAKLPPGSDEARSYEAFLAE